MERLAIWPNPAAFEGAAAQIESSRGSSKRFAGGAKDCTQDRERERKVADGMRDLEIIPGDGAKMKRTLKAIIGPDRRRLTGAPRHGTTSLARLANADHSAHARKVKTRGNSCEAPLDLAFITAPDRTSDLSAQGFCAIFKDCVPPRRSSGPSAGERVRLSFLARFAYITDAIWVPGFSWIRARSIHIRKRAVVGPRKSNVDRTEGAVPDEATIF